MALRSPELGMQPIDRDSLSDTDRLARMALAAAAGAVDRLGLPATTAADEIAAAFTGGAHMDTTPLRGTNCVETVGSGGNKYHIYAEF